jgi:hypothetical protein
MVMATRTGGVSCSRNNVVLYKWHSWLGLIWLRLIWLEQLISKKINIPDQDLHLFYLLTVPNPKEPKLSIADWITTWYRIGI